jgi:regulator of RNase E activity RraA
VKPVDLKLVKEKLYTAVLSDTLDNVGLKHQALGKSIRPLSEDLVMVGRARTALYADIYHVSPNENPYALEIELVDDLKQDDVCVLCCNRSNRVAPWGELLSTAAQVRGAAGCLTDGLVRDIRSIRAIKFPVFHGGIGPLDSKGRGKVIAIDVPVEIDGVAISPGDLIVGDADGVIIIPQSVEDEIVKVALEKVSDENKTRNALRRGAPLKQVFEEFGVL